MIFSLLCSCSTNQIKTNVNQDSNNYIANEDFQNYISEMSSFVKVKDGYYFTSDALLFYTILKTIRHTLFAIKRIAPILIQIAKHICLLSNFILK